MWTIENRGRYDRSKLRYPSLTVSQTQIAHVFDEGSFVMAPFRARAWKCGRAGAIPLAGQFV
jgi:hypothetical protein